MATVYGNYRYFDSGNGWWRTKVDYSGSSATVGIQVKSGYTVWVRITGTVNGSSSSALNYSSSATSSATIGTVSINQYSSNTIALTCSGGSWGQDGTSTATVPKQSTPSAPTCSVSITNIGVDRATCTGQITNNPSNYWRIHLYNTSGAWQTYATGTSSCSFTQTGLAHNTTYNFYHQYTNSSDGEGSGLIAHSFTTSGNAPTISSVTPAPDRTTCSLANNSISYDTNASFSSVSVRYGTTTSYGSTASSTSLTGLTPNTLYYYSMTVTDNFNRTSAAKTGNFTTTGNAPNIGPANPTISRTSVTFNPTVTYDTNDSFGSVRIDYGTTESYGSYVTDYTISNLTPNTHYYYRITVTSALGRSSAVVSAFTTTGNAPSFSSVTAEPKTGDNTKAVITPSTVTYDTNASYQKTNIQLSFNGMPVFNQDYTASPVNLEAYGLTPGKTYVVSVKVQDNFNR